jgi:hypothetical protein
VIGSSTLDEVGLLGAFTASKKKPFVAMLSDYTSGDMNGRGWHADTNRATHHLQLFVWIGNITPICNSRSSSYSLQQQSIHGQLTDILTGKFDVSRVVGANSIVYLRYDVPFVSSRRFAVDTSMHYRPPAGDVLQKVVEKYVDEVMIPELNGGCSGLFPSGLIFSRGENFGETVRLYAYWLRY